MRVEENSQTNAVIQLIRKKAHVRRHPQSRCAISKKVPRNMSNGMVPTIVSSTPRFDQRTLMAGAIGNVLEWYDFALYGYFAPVFAAMFFPSEQPFVSLLSTFGVFAIGFLARPLGALLFGHIGDTIGRREALAWSIILMHILKLHQWPFNTAYWSLTLLWPDSCTP